MRGPLEGIRVLDLSRYIAGPLCAQILGDLGAEVVKVEPLKGEDARHVQPQFAGSSIYTAVFNRNKHAIAIDTRSSEGIRELERLVSTADLLIENYRPGTLDAMGLTQGRLKELNSQLSVISISGFGQYGPNRDRAVFDAVAQAATGLMSLTGTADGPPLLAGTFVADYMTAAYAAIGALAALHARPDLGHGQAIDVALFDVLFSCMAVPVASYATLGIKSRRQGNRDQVTSPASSFRTADGWMYIHGGTNRFFQALCSALSVRHLLEDPRFTSVSDRLDRADEIEALIEAVTASKTSAELEELLTTAGVPHAPIVSLSEAVDSAQVSARQMLIEISTPDGPLRVPGMPIKFSETPLALRKNPPAVGADTESIMARWKTDRAARKSPSVGEKE